MTSSVAERVLAIVAAEAKLDPAVLKPERPLSDFRIASIDLLQIVFALEEEYDITIPYGDAKMSLATVGDVVRVIEELVAKKRAA